MTLAPVSDPGPLVHRAEIGSLELLDTFDTLLVPKTVYKEVGAGGVPDGLADLSYELVEADESRVGTETLDAGERAAIAVTEERGVGLLTDDLAAREAASDAGVDLPGSIDVIALGYRRGLLDRDEAVSRLRALQRETSFFVTEAVWSAVSRCWTNSNRTGAVCRLGESNDDTPRLSRRSRSRRSMPAATYPFGRPTRGVDR